MNLLDVFNAANLIETFVDSYEKFVDISREIVEF
jgi:hypothetical protein